MGGMELGNTLRHRTMHGQVLEALGRDIVAGRIAPGAVFPPEQALCEQLNVSRGALREVMKALAAKGMITLRPRIGTQVRSREEWNVLDAEVLTWLEQVDPEGLARQLTEVRGIIEPGAAEVAAMRASVEDVAQLREAFAAMKAAANGGVRPSHRFTEADVRFHSVLLRSCGNELLAGLVRPIEMALHASFELTSSAPGAVAATLPLHEQVIDAVAGSDPAAAGDAMRQIILAAGSDLDLALSQSATENRNHRRRKQTSESKRTRTPTPTLQ